MIHTEWSPELIAALAEPFPPEAHTTMTDAPGKPIIVGIHEYKDRLNRTVGPHGWESGVRLQAIGGKMVSIVSVTILGVTKENVGDEVEVPELNAKGNEKIIGSPSTNSYSQAFKRSCSDFGLGAYLYDKARARDAAGGPVVSGGNGASRQGGGASSPTCPVCDGPMWDNRESKKNPKAPDYKCKKKECDGVYWPGEWPPSEDTSAQDEVAELDRIAATIQSMINEIKGMDAGDGDAAQAVLDRYVKKPGVTPAHLHRLEANIAGKLEAMKSPVGVGAGDDPDLPF